MTNENKAAPADERDAFDAAWLGYSFSDMRQCAEYFWQAGAAHARAQGAAAAPQGQQEAIGYVMTEGEMGIGFDRRSGPVVWFGGYPKGGSYLYITPQPAPAVAALVEALEACLELIDMISPIEVQTVRKARAALSAFRGEGGE